MPSESVQPDVSRPSSSDGSPPPEKLRIRFAKGGDLRLVSHHDLMQCFERMLRRAEIPFCKTQGFHPKPRMAFAQSLALGVVGADEVVEIEVHGPTCIDDVQRKLSDHAPPGLSILSVSLVDRKIKAHPRQAVYRIAVPLDRFSDLPQRIEAIMNAAECWVERQRPKPRRLDLRPLLRSIAFDDGCLEFRLWITPTGSARPAEVLQLLDLGDLLDQGAVLQRIQLILKDEFTENDDGPNSVPTAPLAGPKPVEEPPVKPAPKPAPLVPGPMSFD